MSITELESAESLHTNNLEYLLMPRELGGGTVKFLANFEEMDKRRGAQIYEVTDDGDDCR